MSNGLALDQDALAIGGGLEQRSPLVVELQARQRRPEQALILQRYRRVEPPPNRPPGRGKRRRQTRAGGAATPGAEQKPRGKQRGAACDVKFVPPLHGFASHPPGAASAGRCCDACGVLSSGSCLSSGTALASAAGGSKCTSCVAVAHHAIGNPEKLLAAAVGIITGPERQSNSPDARRHNHRLSLSHYAASCSGIMHTPSAQLPLVDMDTHMHDILGRSADAVSARGQATSWCYVSLTRRTVVAVVTLCLLVLLLPTACSWVQHARHATPAVAELVVAEQSQPAPDNAPFAICVMMRVASDDPQWVDGRAEDVHEVRNGQL